MSVSFRYALAVWRRNAAMYARTWKWNLLPNFFEPVFYLTAVGIGVGAYVEQMAGMSYVQFLAPGLVCVSAMNGASFEVTYNVFVRLTYEKAYDAILTTPVEPDDVLAGEVLWALTRASIYGGIFLGIVVVFGLASPLAAIVCLPVVVMTGLLFASIGIAFSAHIEVIDYFSFYFTLFLTPLFLFSDVFFPLDERLTPFWQWVAEALPLLHPVRLARAAFVGHAELHLVAWDIAYVFGAAALLLLAARRAFARRLLS
jgi:lipooligosaccharide transport system permease protein